MKKIKYAVAVVKGESELILGVFASEKDADDFAKQNRIPLDAGLHYCFASAFRGKEPIGNTIRIRSYYNA